MVWLMTLPVLSPTPNMPNETTMPTKTAKNARRDWRIPPRPTARNSEMAAVAWWAPRRWTHQSLQVARHRGPDQSRSRASAHNCGQDAHTATLLSMTSLRHLATSRDDAILARSNEQRLEVSFIDRRVDTRAYRGAVGPGDLATTPRGVE